MAAELGTDEDPPSHETSSPVLVMEKSNEQSAQTHKQQSHDSGENSLDGGRESQEESAADRDVDDADKGSYVYMFMYLCIVMCICTFLV